MSQKNNVESITQPPVIEDLSVDEVQSEDVKGGPIYMRWTEIKGDVTAQGYDRSIE